MNVTPENKILFADIIRDNHFGLYKDLADACDFKLTGFDGYSVIMAPNSEWPNMIYQLIGNEEQVSSSFKEISEKINRQELPRFLIIDTFSKIQDFDRLAKQYGFRLVMRWPGMIKKVDDRCSDFQPDSHLEFHKVKNEAELKAWINIVNSTLFYNKELDVNDFQSLLKNTVIQLVLGEYEGTPCSTMLMHYHAKSAGIYCASTLPSFSGKGIMRNFVDHISNSLARSGISYVILEANTASFSLYKKAGFHEVCNFDIYWKFQ